MNDSLAAAMSKLNASEKKAKGEVLIRPSSKLLAQVLQIMKENSYVESFEDIEGVSGKTMKVVLNGNINKCGVIKPRFNFTLDDFERVEKTYLPAKGFGIIIVSTSKGNMTLAQAKEKKVGGRLIAFCY